MIKFWGKKNIVPKEQSDTDKATSNVNSVNNPGNNSTNTGGPETVQGSEGKSTLNPPKNLPDLAKDLFGRGMMEANINASSGEPNLMATSDNVPSQLNLSNLPANMNTRRSGIDNLHEQINSLRDKILIPPKDNDLRALDPDIVKSLRTERVRELDLEKYSKKYLTEALESPKVSREAAPVPMNVDNKDVAHSQDPYAQFSDYSVPNGSVLSGLIDKMRRYHALQDIIKMDASARAMELDILWEFVSKKMSDYESVQRDIEGEALLYADNARRFVNSSGGSSGGSSVNSSINSNVANIKNVNASEYNVKKRLSLQLLDVHRRDQARNSNTISPTRPIMSVSLNESDKYFYLRNGGILKSVYDLINALTYMDQDTYNAHVNPSRNDFANWIEHVFKDVEVADIVRKYPDRNELLVFLKTLL